jgi:hypothetical protein
MCVMFYSLFLVAKRTFFIFRYQLLDIFIFRILCDERFSHTSSQLLGISGLYMKEFMKHSEKVENPDEF